MKNTTLYDPLGRELLLYLPSGKQKPEIVDKIFRNCRKRLILEFYNALGFGEIFLVELASKSTEFKVLLNYHMNPRFAEGAAETVFPQMKMQVEFATQALNRCPYLARTSVSTMRRMSTIPVPKVKGISGPTNALVAAASKCPVMRNALMIRSQSISTSSVCPYASVVDDVSKIGKAGSVDEFLRAQKHGFNLFGSTQTKNGAFDYESFYEEELYKKKLDRSYRYFNNINRLAKQFPNAETGTGDNVTVWCSNDYLGMSRNPQVLDSMR